MSALRGVAPREGTDDGDVCKSVTRPSGDSVYKSHMKAHTFYGPLYGSKFNVISQILVATMYMVFRIRRHV